MPYRKPGTLELCWYILKLKMLDLLGLNEGKRVEVDFVPIDGKPNQFKVIERKGDISA